MARQSLTPTKVGRAGVNQATGITAAHVDGDSVAVTDKTYLVVINGSGGSINVTFQTPGTADGEPIAEKVIAVPAGQTSLFADYQGNVFRNAADGNRVWVDFSAVGSVTRGWFVLDT